MPPTSGSPFRDGAAHPLAGATVLQILPDLEPGEAARAAIEAAAALSRAGANALIASRGGRLVGDLQAKGGVFAPFPAHARNPLRMAFNARRLAQLIKSERVDVVHARSRASAWVAYGATRLTKTPFVTSFHGFEAGGGSALAERYNSVMARGDAILADSAFAADRVAKLYPASRDRIHTVVTGADCGLFSPKTVTPARVQAVRRLWGVAQDERVVYVAASARGLTAATALIDAVGLLARAGDDAPPNATKFIIADAPPGSAFARQIDAAIERAGLAHVMQRAEAGADRPAELLAAAAVVALSAHPEEFAGLALEAQAMGAPVIVAAEGAASETILAPPDAEDFARTGWRTELGAEVIADALRQTLNLGAAARDRLSLRARAHVEARFSMEQMWARTLDAYVAARGDRLRLV